MAMNRCVWIGGTSTDPNVAGNWEDGNVPTDEDEIIFNDQAEQECAGHDFGLADPNDVDVHIIVEESFPFTVGSSGTPLAFNGIDYLLFKGSGTASSYFSTTCAAGDDNGIDNAIVNSPSSANPCVTLIGTIERLCNERGHTAIDSGATLDGRIQIMGATSGSPSVVTVPSGPTTTGLYIAVDGGLLNLSASVPEIRQSGGEVNLKGTAAVTAAGTAGRLEISGGLFNWRSKASMDLIECTGGKFVTPVNRDGRTITTLAAYGSAVVDIRIGGLNITFTNDPLEFGDAQILRPSGLTISGSGQSESHGT